MTTTTIAAPMSCATLCTKVAERRIGRFEGEYHTLAGTVQVMRTVYRKTGCNGDTLAPVSVRAGVVGDGWLPHTARDGAPARARDITRSRGDRARLARLPYCTRRSTSARRC